VTYEHMKVEARAQVKFDLPKMQSEKSSIDIAIVSEDEPFKPLSNTISVKPYAGTWGVPEASAIKNMWNAAPAKPTAQPAKARKVLVCTEALGFPHDSIPIGAKAIEIMGKKSGAWETVISNDRYIFEPEVLAQFDAVMMMSTTGELFGAEKAANERMRKALVDFVAGGKGLAGSHAATDCSYQWREYGDMIGGYFAGHPWGRIVFKVDDPTSPITAAFKGQGFEVSDEMYTFRDPYSRQKQRVLVSIDLEKSKLKDEPGKPGFKQGENRNDHDYAISWIKEYGQGRVFYCSFGHAHNIFWNPAIVQHYFDGMQYAIGDLKADATPK